MVPETARLTGADIRLDHGQGDGCQPYTKAAAISKPAIVSVASIMVLVGCTYALSKPKVTPLGTPGLLSKFDTSAQHADFKEEFVNNCIASFKEGYDKCVGLIKFAEEKVPALCDQYFVGWSKVWKPWNGQSGLIWPLAKNVRNMAMICDKPGAEGSLETYAYDPYAEENQVYSLTFVIPTEAGNIRIDDCARYIDKVKEINGA